LTFSDLAAAAYVWLKALHVVAVIAWMAGLFYLPRLFVYHADSPPGSDKSETFKVMERRLQRVIMNPAMALTWILGLMLAGIGGWWAAPWFQAKVALVIVMTGFDLWLARRRRDFENDANLHPARLYRIVNELPTVLVLAIVILVVVKPF
jgi:putative membrane protein